MALTESFSSTVPAPARALPRRRPRPNRLVEVAIVGLGPWGLCILERTIARARSTGRRVAIHVVEPGLPGTGVYSPDLPDYLILNNPCGQLSLYATPEPGTPKPYGMGLYEWAQAHGYQWHGDRCTTEPGGRPVRPTDFLPRRLMGEYLSWFYENLVESSPANVEIVRHACRAIDIVARSDGGETLVLEEGETVVVDHVVLASGHTENIGARNGAVPQEEPFPIQRWELEPAPGSTVAISGMGLVAFDLLAALTTGRGGRFVDAGDRLVYAPSGREPKILLFSRTGMPYCAKAVAGTDSTGEYSPVVCTPDALASLRRQAGTARWRWGANFRKGLLPLLLAEMRCRYFVSAARAWGGEPAAESVRAQLAEGWAGGTFDGVVESLEARFGAFDPEELLFPDAARSYGSSEDYQRQVQEMIESDLRAANAPEGSPVKAAAEITRILRDEIRSVIEYGGLSLESYLDFQANIRSRVNRIEAGPPALRSAQLLALVDAGIVSFPFGPSPTVEPAQGGVRISSSALDEPISMTVGTVIRGHLDLPRLAGSASPLIHSLHRSGRLREMSYGEVPVGSVDIDERFHPFDARGRSQETISLLGVLTEGARYFTHFLPSPKSRIRAVLDAQALARSLLG